MPTWNTSNAKHLLNRCLFGYSRADLNKALSYDSIDNFIDQELLADKPLPAPPNTWVTEIPTNSGLEGARYQEMVYWWYTLMMKEGLNMREKMTLFWHNHFVSGRDKVGYPQHMYIQNNLFRKNVWGDFRQLTKDVTIDPAMLYYLDGAYSGKTTPNENYARELMELFTVGIGHYTENDIKQAAFALAGWRVSGLTVRQDANQISTINKTFLGKTGNFKYTDIVDILFEHERTAIFICEKLYKEFVFYKPNNAFVEEMAKVLRANKYQIKPVLKFLFSSDEFFKPEYRGVKIKSPLEVSIGTLKAFDKKDISIDDMPHISNNNNALQQQLFYPPDVRGWTGQRDWISTTTYVTRAALTDSFINGRSVSGKVTTLKVTALDFARSFTSAENAVKFIDDISNLFFAIPLSERKRKLLLDTMLDGTVVSNWSTNTPGADKRLEKLYRALMRLPEFQMM
jgi:uncharacterized protein (DUF1800 family)